MIESVKIVTRYIYEVQLFDGQHTEVDAENVPLQRVLENCGYSVDKENEELIFEYRI